MLACSDDTDERMRLHASRGEPEFGVQCQPGKRAGEEARERKRHREEDEGTRRRKRVVGAKKEEMHTEGLG